MCRIVKSIVTILKFFQALSSIVLHNYFDNPAKLLFSAL